MRNLTEQKAKKIDQMQGSPRELPEALTAALSQTSVVVSSCQMGAARHTCQHWKEGQGLIGDRLGRKRREWRKWWWGLLWHRNSGRHFLRWTPLSRRPTLTGWWSRWLCWAGITLPKTSTWLTFLMLCVKNLPRNPVLLFASSQMSWLELANKGEK